MAGTFVSFFTCRCWKYGNLVCSRKDRERRANSGCVKRSRIALFFGLPFEIAERMLNRSRKALPERVDHAFAVRELPVDQEPGIALLTAAAIIERFTGRRCCFDVRQGERNLVTIE